MTNSPRLYLIDGSSYFYRAFFGVKLYLSNAHGLPTNAIYGFTLMLLKIFREEKPDYLAIVFDSPKETFRHLEYKEYKSHRPEMPADLSVQIPYIHNLIKNFNIPTFQKEGFEADDLIGTIACRAQEKGFLVTIVSGDKDLMQLINPQIRLLDTLKNKIFTEKEVIEKFGVPPEKIIDVLGLMGDSADNIPGVPGIGEKGAAKLIQQFGSMENIYQNLEKVEKPSIRDNLIKYKDQALMSKRLCTIVKDVELELFLGELQLRKPNWEEMLKLFKDLEFSSLIKDIDLKQIANYQKMEKNYRPILIIEEWKKLLADLSTCEFLSIDLETTSVEPMLSEIVGISLCYQENTAFYIPIAHNYPEAPVQLSKETVLFGLKSILENPAIKKIGQNIKYDYIVLANNDIMLKGIVFDTMIASYLLNPSKRNHKLEEISLEYLGRTLVSFKDLTGTGKNQKLFNSVNLEQATNYSCDDSEVVFQLKQKIEPLLISEGLADLFNNLETPLIDILVEMERNGIKVDTDFLKKFSLHLDEKIIIVSKQIFLLSGEKFNLNSSRQLADILFNKIHLKPTKKTKTGFSTDVDVLEELADQHPLPAELLNYRQLIKLKSTYVDGLIEMVNPKTNRIHTSFNQTVTATGRLSSSNPNLQNIPIRTEMGKEIRKAFIAEKNHLLLSADYSQIELRILAHFSADEILMGTFKKGEDVHTHTTAQILGLPLTSITNDMRRMGKTINFGIVYGMSPYGLAKELKISPKEAKKFIDQYFLRYRGVKKFIDETIAFAHTNGYTTTILKRKRYIPELKSNNKSIREFGERMAINTPIQGSAADVIKLAMLSVAQKIKNSGLKTKMLLQIHDELVFELPFDEEEILRKLVKESMENVISLSVPLVIDIHTGKNWNEAH